MKIPKSKRLHIVLELAEREELQATEAVQLLQSRLKQEQIRLEELKEYYREYETMFGRRRSGIRASDISREREFLVELTRMQSQQTQQIIVVEKGLNKKLEIWRSCHLKHQALEKLIARLVKEENLALNKKEQQMLDEWFSRVSPNKS